MDGREKIKLEREARARTGDPVRSTTRVEAVNRYLGAFTYVDVYSDTATAAAAEPAEAASRSPR